MVVMYIDIPWVYVAFGEGVNEINALTIVGINYFGAMPMRTIGPPLGTEVGYQKPRRNWKAMVRGTNSHVM